MITLSISPDGDITISQETPGERIYMGEHYARMEREERGELVSQETLNDDERAAMFKQGWESAIRESQIQYVNGRIEEFWNEMGVKTSEDPHHDEPEGTGEADMYDQQDEFHNSLTDAEVWDGLAGQPLIRSAADSGEPDLEAEPVPDVEEGTWTISNEELQSRLDAEFERGMSYSSPTVPPRYSAEQIAELRADAYGRGAADAGQSKKEAFKFAAVRGAFDRAVSEVKEQIEEFNNDLDSDKKVAPDQTSLVLVELFRQLGIEVVR